MNNLRSLRTWLFVLVLIAIVFIVFKLYTGWGHGRGFLPGSNSGGIQTVNVTPDKSVTQEKQQEESPPKEVTPPPTPEKKITFVENLDVLAKTGFSSKALPNILILKFDKSGNRKYYVSISMDEIENYIISESDARAFWEKFEATLVQLRKGESLSGGTGTSGSMTRYFRGILMVDPPTPGIRDYATTKIKNHFPDTLLRVYDGGK
ncbi:MAG: hypothetical protein PHQ75_03820 [Thermoguttaceae bacterium]|nr:hypothetical protein [Thermoguttaceae bacterium]